MEPFWSKEAWSILYEEKNTYKKATEFIVGVLRRFLLFSKIHQFELIFIHREALPVGPPIVEFILAKVFDKKIIYDFDDAIWLQNTSRQNRIVSWIKYHEKVKSICKWSWKVSCGNSFLADYARKFNSSTYINPTTIDTSYHLSKGSNFENRKLVIGWTGTHSTNTYFELIAPVLADLEKIHNIEVLVISDQIPDVELDNFSFIKWEKEREMQQLDKIDIGIMPLKNTNWEQGKCGFKALQYMAMGKPAVVSKVGANIDIIDHGVDGYLYSNNLELKKFLSDLISSESLRVEIGRNARKKVLEKYSVQSNARDFLTFFE